MTQHVNAASVPPALREWYGRLGGEVTIRYTPKGAAKGQHVTGRLAFVAPTGAYVRLTGILDGAERRTLEFPMEDCKLLDRAHHQMLVMARVLEETWVVEAENAARGEKLIRAAMKREGLRHTLPLAITARTGRVIR